MVAESALVAGTVFAEQIVVEHFAVEPVVAGQIAAEPVVAGDTSAFELEKS